MADPKAQVLKLLRGREAKRMHFRFPGGAGDITLSKASFEAVAAAIDAGTVTIASGGSLPAGVGAQYNPGGAAGNTLEIPKIVGRVQEAFILHECLHCFFDITRSNVQDAPEEAAAYIVADLYAKMTGLTDARFSGTPFDQARPIARAILRHQAKGSPGAPVVDASDWATLVSSVIATPIYSALGVSAGSNVYTHDG